MTKWNFSTGSFYCFRLSIKVNIVSCRQGLHTISYGRGNMFPKMPDMIQKICPEEGWPSTGETVSGTSFFRCCNFSKIPDTAKYIVQESYQISITIHQNYLSHDLREWSSLKLGANDKTLPEIPGKYVVTDSLRYSGASEGVLNAHVGHCLIVSNPTWIALERIVRVLRNRHTYIDWYWPTLTDTDRHWVILTNTNRSWRILTDPDRCWLILMDTDQC